jgi:hypothetical protein
MRKATFSLIVLLALAWPFVALRVQAQTFTVLYSFTGGTDGSSPQAGLVRDKAGNLYGTTVQGGSSTIVFWAAELSLSWIPRATRLCCIVSRTHPMGQFPWQG